MRFTCPSCTKTYRLPPERLGPAGRAQISCPNCKAVVLVKAGEGENLICQLLQGGSNSGAVAAIPVATGGSTGIGGTTGNIAVAGTTVRPATGQTARPPSGGFGVDGGSWYVVVGRDKVGPLAPSQIAEKLSAGEVTLHSLAWQKGMAGWTKIEEMPVLLQLLNRAGAQLAARVSGALEPEPRPQSGMHAPVQPAQQPQARPPVQQPQQPQAQPQPLPPPRPATQSVAPVAPAQPAKSVQPVHLGKPAAANTGMRQAMAAPLPAPKPISKAEFDDAGPTLEASLPLAGRLSPEKPSNVKMPTVPQLVNKAPGKGGVNHADAHGDAFFAAGHALNDVEMMLPDPNKHKPTKEEYQNLIQEFSVMFRLDKRSKRQKWLIGVVLTTLVLGAVSFGVVLAMTAQRKKQLIRDSKEIIGAFDLGYRTAVTPTVQQEAVVAEPGKPAVAAAPVAEVSQIADKLTQAVAKRKKAKIAAAAKPTGPLSDADATKKAAELAQFEKDRLERQKAALAAAGGSNPFGGKVEQAVAGGFGGTAVTDSEIRKMCREKAGMVAGCAEKVGANPSLLKVTVTTLGTIGDVVAIADGKANGDLGTCIQRVMGKVNYGTQPSRKTVDCKVD